MTHNILYCKTCNKFTMKESCSCGEKTITTKPAKFSLDDKWGKYRRISKKEQKDL